MAQHDYVIDNSTGANVRADINSALLAISSNNSGSSAPSTTYALQSFANTTDSILQLRNAANNAFVNLRKFDGSLPLPDGSESSPSLFFDDDTNTGIYSSATDTLNITTGGSTAVTVNSSQNVGIGNTAPLSRLHVEDVEGTTLTLGNTAAAASDGDYLSGIDFHIKDNNDGTGATCASIRTFADQNHTASAKGTALALFTTDDDTTTLDERLRITHDGKIGIGTTSPTSTGIQSGIKTVQIDSGDGAELILGNSQSSGVSANHIGAIAFKNIDTSLGTAPHYAGIRCNATDSSGNMNLKFYAGSSKFETDSPHMLIDSSGSVLIGTNNSVNVASGSPALLQVEHASGNISAAFYSTANAAGPSGVLALGHARGGSTGALVDDDVVGEIRFAGGDGSDINTQAALIQAKIDGSPSSNNMPTDLIFFTNSGGQSVGQRMIIHKNGDIGAPTGDNVHDASDERLKENIIELSDCLNKINQLKPISYNYKTGWNKYTEGKTKYGFGAQTTQKVDELLIESFSDEDVDLNGVKISNILRVNEKFIIPMLVKAIQELSAKVEALEAN